MKKIILDIEGMTCSACSNGLEKYLKKQKGIVDAYVNLIMATAMIEYDESLEIGDLEKFIEEAGFKSLGEKREEKQNQRSFKFLILFVVLGILLMYVSMGHMIGIAVPAFLNMELNPTNYILFQLIVTILFLIFGFDIIKNGIRNIVHKMPNMDSLVGIGVIVNFLYSLFNAILFWNGNSHSLHNLYFESSAIIILFVKLGRYIDKKNKLKAVDTIKNLVTITPKSGTILKDGEPTNVTINEIKKGDIVICKPGEKIATDGIIVNGMTHTDESFITGESKPVNKNVGSRVLAGSINYDGYIEYQAEKIGKDSSISSIVQMVVEATNTKAPIERLADKISSYFVPIIFGIAIVSFLLNFLMLNNLTSSILALVSVLVVACPCALGLATPLAMVVSIGKYSKKGILIKNSAVIESINKIDTVVFDKTGTLTKGNLAIVNGEYTEENLKILKSLESHSNHPIAKSISDGDNDVYQVENYGEIAGFGIKGKINGKIYFAGNSKFVKQNNVNNTLENYEKTYSKNGESIVYLFDERETLAIIGLADEIKEDSLSIVEKLYSLNKRVVMLTGDNEETAKAVANKLGINEIISNASPKDKLDRIKELGSTLMVGDGINDSPALKTATVGVSVSNGSDISADSSDIVLLTDNMHSIVDIFKIGNKTMKIIKQNLFWALFYNICMIPLATGLLPISLNPMIASLAMTLSSFTVVINSLRLL